MIDELRTPPGEAALVLASSLGAADPLAAAAALRRHGVPADLAAAALTQAELRRRAVAKFGPDAARMFFTRAGLEQATRVPVADRRAARLSAAGVRSVADLGCGIGADTLAFARAGIRVLAVEADPPTASVAAANAAVLGLAGLVEVRCADARAADLSGVDAVFCDPARRRGTGRVFDPRAWSPSWDFVAALPGRVPATVLKLAPGTDHALIPAGAEAEWVSVDGDVVEAAFWCGPLAEVPRRASLLPSRAVLTGSGVVAAPVGPVRRYLFDPDGAVVRAHLVAEFAATVDGTLADPQIAYVYSDAPAATPFARRYEVLDVLPFSVKRLRAVLRERGTGRLTVKKRGSPVDPDQLRTAMRLSGTAEATVVLTRVAGAPTALLVEPG
ncbi:MAG: class I SAM-dependent methyltransferase [Actinobacteria bacterium]|nr:MAG: class I SAM-dependent methyltransferase [Actinomycetota bacterium]